MRESYNWLGYIATRDVAGGLATGNERGAQLLATQTDTPAPQAQTLSARNAPLAGSLGLATR